MTLQSNGDILLFVMQITHVQIKRFRSIDDIELRACGNFNVLIGKNNSGKSNVLSAIRLFFKALEVGPIVAITAAFQRSDIDFFERDLSKPIEITVHFSLSLPERDGLLRDIVGEAPQMKHAIDGFGPYLTLSVTVSIVPLPSRFGYVSDIKLGPSGDPVEAEGQRSILSINLDSAIELYQSALRLQQIDQETKAVGVIADRVRDVAKRPANERKEFPFRYILRDTPVSVGTATELERIAYTMENSEQAGSEIARLLSKWEAEAEKIQRAPLRHKISTFSGEESSIPQYVQRLLVGIGSNRVLYLREQRASIGKEEAQRLLELKTTRGGPQVLRRIQDTVAGLLGVQIDAFNGDASARGGGAELDVDNFLVQVNGAGIRESLRLVLDFEFQKPTFLFVEEPETHLHPAFELNMMRYLREVSSSSQVFITTHSTNFLDSGQMKNVYLVNRNPGTSVQAIDGEEMQAVIPQELGLRLSALFMYDRLAFVEGPSDEAIMREWATTLQINLSQANVGFVPMQGARNLVHFAAPSTMEFLSRRQVESFILIDHDERDSVEIERISEKFAKYASVIVLSRREIENYLVVPRAIAHLIADKLGKKGEPAKTPPVEAVVTALDAACERLKSVAIAKRVAKYVCGPIYPSRDEICKAEGLADLAARGGMELERTIESLQVRKQRLEELVKEQRLEVESTWAEKKREIVPGDLLLDLTFQSFGLRFIKDRDGAKLAAHMNESEIVDEIKAILRKIGMPRASARAAQAM